MKKLILLLAGSLLFATPSIAHTRHPNHPNHGKPHRHHPKYLTHNHCHFHYKRYYSHCHRHRHDGPGKGHHGNKWFHGIYPYSLEFNWYTH